MEEMGGRVCGWRIAFASPTLLSDSFGKSQDNDRLTGVEHLLGTLASRCYKYAAPFSVRVGG
jgi:hypothetical protein